MIPFYYEIPKLFNRIQNESLRHSKSLRDKDGKSMGTRYAISDEDDAIIRKFIKESAVEVSNILSPYGRTLADLDTPLEPFEWEATFTDDDESTTDDCVIFRIIEPTNYDTTKTNLLENVIEGTMVYYALSKWLFKNSADGVFYKVESDDMKGKILWYLSHRTATIKRTYKYF